jgi:lactoylglutathione lyase
VGLDGLDHDPWELHHDLVRLACPSMRTLQVGLRVSDLERSLAFYTAVGYTVVGTVEGTAFGSLTMLRLPGDDFVTIELVHDPARGNVDLGTGINHLVIQVESLDSTLADLAGKGIVAEPPGRFDGADGAGTSWITDPDGYRIELVQWPAGHADGTTEAGLA